MNLKVDKWPAPAAEVAEHGRGAGFVGAVAHPLAVGHERARVAQPLVAALAAKIARPPCGRGVTLVHV